MARNGEDPDLDEEDGEFYRRIPSSFFILRCTLRVLENACQKSPGKPARNGVACLRKRDRSMYVWQKKNGKEEDEEDGGEREEEDADAFNETNKPFGRR